MNNYLKLLFVCGFVIAGTAPVKAGFEWVPPTNMPPAQQMPMYNPSHPMAPADQPHDFFSGDQTQSSQEKLIPPRPPIAGPDMPSVPSTAVESEAIYDELVGFGTDIPLALAMRKIIPDEYSYAFDLDVDLSTPISWSGGKPWNKSLEDAIMPYGLEAFINEHAVRISRSTSLAKNVEISQAQHQNAAGIKQMILTPKKNEQAPEPVHAQMQPPPKMDATDHVVRGSESDITPIPLMGEEPAPTPMAHQPMQPSPVMPQSDVAYAEENSDMSNMPQNLSAPRPPVAMMEHAAPMQPTRVSVPPAQPKQPVHIDINTVQLWSADQGADVRSLLTMWSEKAGVKLYWGARSDYRLKMPVEVHGTYTQAIQAVLETYGEQVPRPWGRLHPNLSDGNTILIVRNYPDY